MLNSNHRKKVPIKKCKTLEISQMESEKLSNELNMSIVKY